jgi:hypothetical protein
MSKDLVLLIFEKNWADEFDTEGFAIIERKGWEFVCREARACSNLFPQEIYFGTNEGHDFATVEEFIKSFTVTPIEEKHADMLKKMFNFSKHQKSFGICPYWGMEGEAPDEFYEEDQKQYGEEFDL